MIFIFLIVFIPLEQKTILNYTKKVGENKDFCNILMPSEDTRILEFNQDQKSDKAPIIIYVDLECEIQKIHGCKNNPENSSTTKVSEQIPSGFSMSTMSSLRIIKIKHGIYSGKDCMKKFYESLREHPMKIINFNKKKNEVINKRAAGIHENAKAFYICKENFENEYLKDKKYRKLRDIFIIQGNMEVLRIAYVI